VALRRSLLALLLTMSLAPAVVAGARRPGVAEAASTAITTIAGGGAGDGGGATSAAVSPYDVAVDGAGNLYIADGPHCRVRKVSGGIVTTVAGTGICGYSGDGGAGTSARVGFVVAVAFDASSNALLIADTDNCRIRRLAGGVITTVAGTGVCSYSGDGGAATAASLAHPHGVAIGPSGELYIGDTDNCRVRVVSGGTITTAAGSGVCGFAGDGGAATSARLDHPHGVAVDGAGTLYIADTENCRVRVVVFPASQINTLAGDGTCAYGGDGASAAAAQLARPRDVAVSSTGDTLIADTDNCRVRRVSYPTTVITTLAGGAVCGTGGDGGAPENAQLSALWGLSAASTGTVALADTGNCRARTIAAGTIATAAGNGFCDFAGDGGPATDAAIADVSGVATDGAGNIYLADTTNCRIRKIATNNVVTTAAGRAACGFDGDGIATDVALDHPRGIAADAAGNLWIADTDNCRIRRRDASTGALTTVAGTGVCGYAGDGGAATSARLNFPHGVAVAGGKVYIADTLNCRIRVVSGPLITTVAGSGSCASGGDGGPPLAAGLTFPEAVAVGADGTIYIADTGGCRLRRVSGGTISLVAGNGPCGFAGDGGAAQAALLDQPSGLVVTGDGSVLVADSQNCRVRVVSGSMIATIAGSTSCGYAGDGGPATAALLAQPRAVAVDGSANILIADAVNHRVRRVAAGSDIDGDGVPDIADNCPSQANASQANNDRNFIGLAPWGKPFDDLTLVNSDATGDACDPNDDNDGLTDAQEAGLGPGGAYHGLCQQATASTDPARGDTDGDRVLDGAECALGTDPTNAASVPPPLPPVADDPDRDGLTSGFELVIGTNPSVRDTDGDGFPDGLEYRYLGSSPLTTNTDGDVCDDGREVTSVNSDLVVTAADLGLVAAAFGPSTSTKYVPDFDITRDGVISAADLGFVAAKFGAC